MITSDLMVRACDIMDANKEAGPDLAKDLGIDPDDLAGFANWRALQCMRATMPTWVDAPENIADLNGVQREQVAFMGAFLLEGFMTARILDTIVLAEQELSSPDV